MKEYYAGDTITAIKSKITRIANKTGERTDGWLRADGTGYSLAASDYFGWHKNPYYGVPVIHLIAFPGVPTGLCQGAACPLVCPHVELEEE